ncbi:hypothetical protein B0H17DRAFT_1058989 [Mycena rosella]|uniref:BAG domain-containing protein n=1 Tax=Mycena rosella TaxID=1033263 RepID=A0AAD7GJD0_MYCRO|nr:hypothetical protein B0H17DRAFT_1058989 [Mycena rosella]
MFMGHGHPAPKAPEPSSSKPASGSTSSESALKQELEARLRSQQSSEERDLAEAIRMSLAEAAVAPAPADPKGKAPAPAPVKDVTTSTAEVHSIDAAFTTLSAEFAFPAELDFSTSRPASPVRAGAGAAEGESVMAKLSYSARNQGVRFYQQGLSGLLAQLDAVESFGDEELRHARKEVVGRVEGALDELERVVEARWRKFAGRVERVEAVAEPESASVPVPVESAAPAPVESAAESVEEAPVIVDAEEVPAIEQAELVIDTVEPTVTTSAVAESSPAAEVAYPPVSESSYPPAVESPAPDSSSYPPSESVETLRPAESPAPSDIDTFLLPAESAEAPAKKPRASEEDVGSDWSEVDA